MTIVEQLLQIREESLIENRKMIVDCLIENIEGNIFAQKRSPDRKKFPNCWDLPGGTVEQGESISEAAKREIKEELDFDLVDVTSVVKIYDYELPESMRDGKENYKQRIIVLKVRVLNTTNPVLEKEKVTAYDWFSLENLDVLLEGRNRSDDGYDYVYKTVKSVLSNH